MNPFAIGTPLDTLHEVQTPQIESDHPILKQHLKAPWLRAYIAEKLDIDGLEETLLSGNVLPHSGGVVVTNDKVLRTHSCLVGGSGSGKTRLALLLAREQMAAGYSFVALDPKDESIMHLLDCARLADVPEEDITLFLPGKGNEGIPGWNPLDFVALGVPLSEAVSSFVTVLGQTGAHLGVRVIEILTNALTIIAGERLTILELVRFLQREDYRVGLLNQIARRERMELSREDERSLRDAVEFFQAEFANWGKDSRESVSAVLNKVRELTRVGPLRTLLCAEKSSVDFASLWKKRQIILVHLDESRLGKEGVRLLGGQITNYLYQTCMRVQGPIPVVLSLDEIGVSQDQIGDVLIKILAIARSRGLRLLLTCQYLAMLSPQLRQGLLTIPTFRAFFRQGADDARFTAVALTMGVGDRIEKIQVEPEGFKGKTRWRECKYRIVDEIGQSVTLTAEGWGAWERIAGRSRSPWRGLQALARLSKLSGLLVETEQGRLPLERVVRGISYQRDVSSSKDGDQEPVSVRLQGPSPLYLIVRFVSFQVKVTRRVTESEQTSQLTRKLLKLPERQALIWQPDQPLVKIGVSSVPDPSERELERLTSRICQRQARENPVEETLERREAAVKRIIQGIPDEKSESPQSEEDVSVDNLQQRVVKNEEFVVGSDGSLA